MASHVPRVHLYRHAGFPLQENPGVPVLAPYGFNMGGGSDIMHLLHSRLAALPQAPLRTLAELFCLPATVSAAIPRLDGG